MRNRTAGILTTAFLLLTVFLILPRAQNQPAAPSTTAKTTVNEKPLEWETVVNAPVDEVWDAFTTKKGMESWMVAVAEIDLKIGGVLITSYNPNARVGNDESIVHTIISFEPKRMLSTRLVRVPANAPFAQVTQQGWNVFYFEPLSPKQTRVRLASVGWGDGPEWTEARKFFQAGNAYVLNKLKEHFAGKPAVEGK